MLPVLLSIIWFVTFINQSGVYHNIQITIPTGCTVSTVGYGWATLINYVFPNGTAYVGGVYYVENYVACPTSWGPPGTGVGFTICTINNQFGITQTWTPNGYVASISYPVFLSFQNGTKALVYPSTWWFYLINIPGYLQAALGGPWPSWPLGFQPCFLVTTIPASNTNVMYEWFYYPVAARVFVGKQQYWVYTTTPNKMGPFKSLPFSVPTPTITGLGVSPINQSVPVGAYAVVNITEYGNAYIPPTLFFAGSQYCMYMPHIGLTETSPGRYNGVVSVAGYLANFTITYYQPTTVTPPKTTTHLGVAKPSNYTLIVIAVMLIIALIAVTAYVVAKHRHGRGGVRL